MGTRAAFWIGDPRNVESRRWLGAIAWDGYPDGLPELAVVRTEADFIAVVKKYEDRRDFALPSRGWPFPWADNIFLTDYNYAFFDDVLQGTCFRRGFVPFAKLDTDEYHAGDRDTLPSNVPAGKAYDPSQPDSILILRAR